MDTNQAVTRFDVVDALDEVRDVLVGIDSGTVDRRYVDFAALANRLEACAEAISAHVRAMAARGKGELPPPYRV